MNNHKIIQGCLECSEGGMLNAIFRALSFVIIAMESDYQLIANGLKEQGNDAFKANNVEEAINLYSQALDIDPDNYVVYSNRSAAYLKSDFKSNALYDAEKCVSLAPTWAKGYSRLGAAQQSLKRFNAAIDSFKKGS